MNDKDLMDVLKALTHLTAGLEEIGKKVPDESNQILLAVNGSLKAIVAVMERHRIPTEEKK